MAVCLAQISTVAAPGGTTSMPRLSEPVLLPAPVIFATPPATVTFAPIFTAARPDTESFRSVLNVQRCFSAAAAVFVSSARAASGNAVPAATIAASVSVDMCILLMLVLLGC